MLLPPKHGGTLPFMSARGSTSVMRQSLRILGFGFLSLVSLETAVAIIDWSARWDWFTKQMVDHPHFAAFIRTPFSYLILILMGFAFLFIERRLKAPTIIGRVTNLHALP